MSFHMRRKDKEITDPSVMKKILKAVKYVTLAMAMDDQPYLISLSCGYDEKGNCLYFHCAKEGKKFAYLKANNTVWGQALLDHGYIQGECDHKFASVHFKGRVTFLSESEEKLHAIRTMIRQLDRDPDALISKLKPERLEAALIGRIDIELMTGKKTKELTI